MRTSIKCGKCHDACYYYELNDKSKTGFDGIGKPYLICYNCNNNQDLFPEVNQSGALIGMYFTTVAFDPNGKPIKFSRFLCSKDLVES